MRNFLNKFLEEGDVFSKVEDYMKLGKRRQDKSYNVEILSDSRGTT